MEKQLVAVAISTWLVLILMIHSAWAADVTFDVGTTATKNTYSTALQALRDKVKDGNRQFFGIPMLPRPPNPLTYILVELKYSQTTSITLALDTKNLYVVGYTDTVGANVRFHYFPDAPHNANTSLFPNAKGNLRLPIKFASSYSKMEGAAGVLNRMTIGLGMKKLGNRVHKVFGAAVNDKTQAEFLLIAVQMVAEATRFKYIEKQVLDNFDSFEFRPDYKFISLENEWGKISTGIRNANTATKVITPPIEIQVDVDRKVKVTNVTIIKPAMALLNYVA